MTATIEVWKSVPGYEGLYEVSDLGRVRSLHFKKRRILRPYLNADGYFTLVLSKNGKTALCYVHRMVAQAFLGEGSKTVDHINGDKTDNRFFNLQYLSRSDNVRKYHYTKWEKKRKKDYSWSEGGTASIYLDFETVSLLKKAAVSDPTEFSKVGEFLVSRLKEYTSFHLNSKLDISGLKVGTASIHLSKEFGKHLNQFLMENPELGLSQLVREALV